ncbi:TWiK family of potassium channels protein 7-like [Penaeus indicus]|uniref:TWiK family of potassium channels protein 7-like n=1 Tax=Penaeus indicus TaxID=29960 RepID=UPI00300C9F02
MPPPSIKKMSSFISDKDEKKSCGKTVARIMFSHVGLFILVSVYTVVGAYLFISIEKPAEEMRYQKKRNVAMDINDATKYIISLLWYHNSLNHTKAEYHSLVMKNLVVFHEFVVAKSGDSAIKYDGNVNKWDWDWTLSKSLLFTVTSIAAIGYGHIAPKTFQGRVFTIFYNVIGIPLLLVFLANIGDFLANTCRYLYSRLCCRWCRIRRRISEQKKGKTVEKRSLWKDDVGFETFMPTNSVDVPIVVNLCIITVYLMLGGALFSWWENWNLLESVYFTFITLTTIGFGDYVPGNSFLDLSDGLMAAMKMLVTVLFCLFGMALLSMCINLMQEQLVAKSRWLAREIGLIEEEVDPMVKYKYKKSKRGTVPETQQDRDGNKRLSLMPAYEGESTTTKAGNFTNIQEELEDL